MRAIRIIEQSLQFDYDESRYGYLDRYLKLHMVDKRPNIHGVYTNIFTNIRKHPLEVAEMLDDCDISKYHTEGIIKIKTKTEGMVILDKDGFRYDPPF